MNTKSNFCEFQGRDDKGHFIVRLASTTYKYANGMIFIKNEDDSFSKLSLDVDVAKPWIRQNLEREVSFQMRKARAIALKSSYIPSHERKAYKHRMNWTGSI